MDKKGDIYTPGRMRKRGSLDDLGRGGAYIPLPPPPNATPTKLGIPVLFKDEGAFGKVRRDQ